MIEFLADSMERYVHRILIVLFLLALAAIPVRAQQATPAAEAPVPSDQWESKKITPPKLLGHLTHIEGNYPDDARIKNIDGMCLVSVTLDTQGDPQDPRIIHCTDPSFEDSSLNAAKQYRFTPATTQDGRPVAVTVLMGFPYHLIGSPIELLMIDFHLERYLVKGSIGHEIGTQIHYGFIPQRGGASNPDSNGVYPFTRSVTGPRVAKFSDEKYGRIAFVHEGNSICDVVLTIDLKGKASDPQVTHCERPELEKPAIDSLLKSQYTPGFVHGKAVPMRASMHLEYGDIPAKP